MRLQVLSDFHIDIVDGFQPCPASNVDAVVVAGDVCEGIDAAAAFLRQCFPAPLPIVLVPGNHEYYDRTLTDERRNGPAAASSHNVTLLDDKAAIVQGVRFIGATLWTDFCLLGADRQPDSMALAQKRMNDYRCIRRQMDTPDLITPADILQQHRASLAFLQETLAQPFNGQTVVVTHHAPHARSIHQRFAGAAINTAYVSDQSELIASRQPAAWIHGHVHNSFDYRLGATRVVCNPRGYGRENPDFNPEFVIDV